MNMESFRWTREPKSFLMENGTASITTLPHTDLWQRTYYHFRNDNAPVLQMESEEKYFSFIVKTSFAESHQRFDQCGKIRGEAPASDAAQALVKKLQSFISEHYYTCTDDILRALGQMYAGGGEMTANIDRSGGEGTSAFAAAAIEVYCK